MKRILFGIYMFVVALSVWAVPARPFQFKVTQPDGTELVVRTYGDEYFHALVTEDGTVVKRDPETGWYQPIDETTFKTSFALANEKRQRINQDRMMMAAANRSLQASAHDVGVRCPYEGNKRGLVILVNFKDKTFSNTREEYDKMFNQEGYSGNNHNGSVRDYFRDQSYGKLTIDFDVVGPVTVSQKYSYYGKNDYNGSDNYPEKMITEACQLVDSMVDFSKYDWGGNGQVDQVYVVYAGYGENYTSEEDPNTIWPHEYKLSYTSSALKLDGVKVDTYACSAELAYASGNTRNGIGVACHEFSHCLGFPDFYDSNYNACPSMSDWSLMDAGSYSGPNGLGEVPVGMTAYERWIGGWLEFTELKDPCIVENMPNLGDSACAYIIYNEKERYEAYILENRQNKKWFKYPTNAHGMLIYHVDYDEYSWAYNEVNTKSSHPRMIYVPANNTYGELVDYGSGQSVYVPSSTDLRGQLWPGTKGKTALTNSTTPAAKTYNANTDGTKFLNAPIEKITETNGKIGFYFKGGINVAVPKVHLSADAAGIKLDWDEVEGATSYEVKISANSRFVEGYTMSEPMTKLTVSTDGTVDISSKLDQYMSVPGWTGKKVFQGKNGAKVGTSTIKGYLNTPHMSHPSNAIVVNAKLTGYGSDDKTVYVYLMDKNGSTVQKQSVTADGSVRRVEFSGVTDSCYVQLSSAKRVYIGSVEIVPQGSISTSTVEQVAEGTSYTLSEVSDSLTYLFQVRAIAEQATSEWSEAISYETEYESAIENRVYVADTKNIQIDLFGRRVNDGKNKFTIKNNHLIYQKK